MLAKFQWIYRHCPVCNRDNAHLLFRDRNRREGYEIETDLVECSTCGMRYLNPVPTVKDWMDKYEEGHKLTHSSSKGRSISGRYVAYLLDQWAYQLWARDMRLHYAPFGRGGGKRILDIGCSKGEKLKQFHIRGFEVYGIDVSETAITEAQQRVSGDFRVGTFEEADYPPGLFDFIRFDNVLEHIYNPWLFLQKVFSLLRPGGAAYGYVPNGGSPTMRLMGKYSVSSWVPFHINLFKPRPLLRLAREAGFEASVTPISNPNWVALSVYQWLNRNQKQLDFAGGLWTIKIVGAIAAPIWWVLKRLGTGEEICLEAIRPIVSHNIAMLR
jgi:SAM-dependent methyltransferase